MEGYKFRIIGDGRFERGLFKSKIVAQTMLIALQQVHPYVSYELQEFKVPDSEPVWVTL